MPLLLMLLFQQAVSAPPEPPASSSTSWSNFRAAVNQQSLQTVLISIEERLRALDTLYSPRYTPRWEISIEQQSRRMETIESRLGRLETLLELRLDKLSETLSARQLKEELAKDQINRKIDSTYERLNHRLGYLEARLDVGIAKLQSTVEAGVGRMERLETTAVGRRGEIETELTGIGSGIDDVRKQLTVLEERYNSSLTAIVEHGKHMATEMNNLTTRVEDLHVEFNKTQSGNEQNDDEGNGSQKTINIMVEKITNGIDRHATNFITKANNMYNDMWRRTQLLEGLAKDTMSLSNATRRELQEGIRTIALQIGRRGLFQSDRERQEGSMDIALDTLGLIQRRLNELGRKFDSSFQMLMLAQNLFLESCHRIQLDEPQMETKLTRVLERILDTITNRSMNTDQELREIEDLLKSHGAHMTRSLGHATNTLVQSSEKTTQLQIDLLSTREQLLEGNKYIEDAISDIREEKLSISEKIDTIVSTLQEVQDSIAEIVTTKQLEDKFNDSCPDSEQIAIKILSEIQRGNMDSQNNMGVVGFKIKAIYNNSNSEPVNLDSGNISSEEENIMEGKRNISSNENISNFQLQHRFDIQNNRDYTFQTPQVSFEIKPDSTNIKSNNTKSDKHEGISENLIEDIDNPLLQFDLQNVAAIIQDSNSEAKNQQPILTIVHTILNMNSTNIGEDMNEKDLNVNSNSNLTHANTTIILDHTVVSEMIHNVQNRSTEGEKIIPKTNLTENLNGTKYNASIALETAHQNWNAHTRETELELENPTKTNFSSEHKSEIRTPEIIKKLLELRNSDKKYNLSDENVWRTLISKLQESLNSTRTEDEVNNSEENKVKPKLAIHPFITNTGELQPFIRALNDTQNVQPQQYLNRLQELATELVTRSTNLTNEETEEMLDR